MIEEQAPLEATEDAAVDQWVGEEPPEVIDAEPLTVSEKENLVRYLTDEERKNHAARVRTRFDLDVASRSKRMKKCRDLERMYAMVAEPKSFPWSGAANVKTPALTGPQLQIQSRLFDMIWPVSGNVFSVLAGTVDEMPFAHVTERFANSYVRYHMPSYGQGWDDTIHQGTLYGSAFRRVYWNALLAAIDAGPVAMDDFVVNYRYRSEDPSMSDVPRYTMIHHLAIADIEELAASGQVESAEEVKAHAVNEDFGGAFRDEAQKIDGTTNSQADEDDEDRKRPVLEQHYRMRMPLAPETHPAFDGKAHYVYALLDAWSGTLLRISLREEDDPADVRRFQREQARFDEYAQRLRDAEAALMAPPAMPAGPMAPGFEGQDVFAPTFGAVDGGPAGLLPAAPAAPAALEIPDEPPPPEPAPVRKRQICFFTHVRCFPSDGFYGLGYGDILYGLAVALNTTINQHLDGVTLKNAKPGFISRNAQMQRGGISVQPGSFVEIDAPMSGIRDAIMFLDPPGNDPTTVPLIQMLDRMKDAMVGSADVYSGQIPKSNQTASGIDKLIEQALTPVTVLGRRFREAFSHELRKIWRCFGVFLEDSQIEDIVGEGGQPERLEVRREMFTPSARLIPTADPRAKTQKVSDHQALFGYVVQNPFFQMNPPVMAAVLRALTEEGFRIFPDGERLMQYLPPPGPQGPPPPVPAIEENASFLNGKPAQVNPADNDDEHLMAHQQFMASPEGQMVDPKVAPAVIQHLRDHVANKMRKGAQQLGQQGAVGGLGGFGSGGMARPPAFPAAGAAPQGGM